MKRINQKSFNYSRYIAFTLAEVLITLGIIGVVAMMTIPALIEKTQDKEMRVAWKKEYSALSLAYEGMKNDEGGDLSSHFDPTINYVNSSEMFPLLNKYLATQKICGPNFGIVCGTNADLSTAYKDLAGSYISVHNLAYYQEILNDGANIYSRQYMSSNMLIWVDVNGFTKGPNILGKDLFGMEFNATKAMPMGVPGSGLENSAGTTAFYCPGGEYGFHPSYGCAGAGYSAQYLIDGK